MIQAKKTQAINEAKAQEKELELAEKRTDEVVNWLIEHDYKGEGYSAKVTELHELENKISRLTAERGSAKSRQGSDELNTFNLGRR